LASLTTTASQVGERTKRSRGGFDWYLLLAACLLLTFGLMSQFSKAYGTTSKEFVKQSFNVVVGLVPFFIFWLVKPKFWMRAANALYFLNLGLLVLVLVAGANINGSERWINIAGIQFQPSEAAKILLILTLATFFARRADQINRFSTFALSFLHIVVPVVLVVKQPHLGAAVAILATWLCICLAAQVPWKFVLGAAVGSVAFLVLAFTVPAIGKHFLKGYHMNRTGTFMGSKVGGKDEDQKTKDLLFQQDRAAIAFGNGGLFGTGFLKGEQKRLNMIPFQSTDFVFTVVGEEGGLMGSLLVLATFGFFFYRIWLVFLNATEGYYRMIAAGILGMLAFHTVINLAMVLQLMPVVGLWLPFMSYGGTAMWLCLACVGLLLNVRSREKPVLF
jgi:rod shape determining protein RodA